MDPAAFRVTKAGRPVPLEPKAFEVLLVLLERPGRLVEKRELLERVWPDAVVTESAMTRVIADLRRALGDAAREARYIETVPTKGYRFIAEVRPAGASAAPSPRETAAPAVPGRRIPVAWIAAGVTALALLAVLAFRAPRSKPAAAPTPGSAKLSQLTESLGLDMFPTFSPDGAQIAFCSDREGSFEIYVRQLAPGGREIRITSDGRDNFQPAWSPDGREIAYASRTVPGIWIIPALGGEPRRLSTFGSRPAWSPDGATIAFQSGGVIELSATAPAAPPPSSLWVVPSGGGEPAPLTRPGTPLGGHGAPTFSPDGTQVVFATWSVRGELWSVSRKDGSLHRILPAEEAAPEAGSSERRYFDPAFSPKGDVLYFAATDRSWLNSSLWRMRTPGPGRTWGPPERVTPEGTTSVRHLAVSRTGTIAYAALSIVSNLWSLPLDPETAVPTGEAVLLTRGAGCRNTSPRFSPDGSTISFVSCRAGSSTDVWIMDRDGGNARPITDGSSETHFPNWFPGGDRIAYFTMRGGRKELWAVSRGDRSQRRLLSLDADVSHTYLSPDGRFVSYTKEEPDRGLSTWVAPLDGGPARQVTPAGVSAGYPCWSRDGRSLAVDLMAPPDVFLAVVPTAGGEPEVLVKEKGLSWPYDWSADGRRISFEGQRDGIWNVYWVARSGGPAHRLTANTTRRAFLRYPVWSPQGDRIVYEHSESTGNVWLLDPAR